MKYKHTGAISPLVIYFTERERIALEALAKDDARTQSSEVRALVKTIAKQRSLWPEAEKVANP